MTPTAERIARWSAQVRHADRAATVEQCLDAIDALLALVAPTAERKAPARARGRVVRDEGRRATGRAG